MNKHTTTQAWPDAAAGPGGHLTLEELAAYRAGELPGTDGQRVLDHLMTCRDCVDLLLLDPEIGGDPAPRGVARFEVFAAWRAFQAKLEAARRPRDGVNRWWRAAVAASLVALLPTGWMALHYRAEAQSLLEPQLNPPIHDVRRPVLRGAEVEEESTLIELTGESHVFTLVLAVETECVEHEVRLLDRHGRELWRAEGLEVDEVGTATLGLSRRFLDAGDEYLVEIFGRPQPDGELKRLASHPIMLREP